MINLDVLNSVRERIEEARQRAGRSNTKPVTIVAVTKTFPSSAVIVAHKAGLTNIGENRIQEAADKFPELPKLPGLTKRLIGHLQSNKARKAVNLFDSIDSVDSLKLARRLNIIGEGEKDPINILLQVNTGRDPAKHGFSPDQKETLQKIIEMSFLNVKGLMTIGSFTLDKKLIRETFIALYSLQEVLNTELPEKLKIDELSMGMTSDFEIAAEEGATMVRLGSALFGQRVTP